MYVGDHGKFAHLVKNQTSIDSFKTIYAGKFRRYYGESTIKKLTDIRTILLNTRDLFYFIIGFFQSVVLILRTKPDAIFLKGSYVGMPLGLAAALLGKPYITHDSDAIASLTNKVVGKWAKYNATGVASGKYAYAPDKIRYVGVPVASEYKPVNSEDKANYRHQIDIPVGAQMILITGGSSGASKLNQAFDKIINELIDKFSDLYIVLQTGKDKLSDFKDLKENPRVSIHEFLQNMYKYSGAADVVVSRGGANSISELAAQSKACLIIPNPMLAAGHQTKNAEVLADIKAAKLIYERELINDPEVLSKSLQDLLNNSSERKVLSDNIHRLAQPDAANNIAKLLISLTKNN